MRSGNFSGKRVAHSLLPSLVAIAVAGCNIWEGPMSPPAPPPLPSAAFDGTYAGTIHTAGASVSMQRENCETPPRFTIQVIGGRFTVKLLHPKAANTPGLSAASALTYTASIFQDGSISGVNIETNTTMHGRVSAGRMTGEVNGLLCFYDFVADRV